MSEEATPEERERLLNALEDGQVKWTPVGQRYLERGGDTTFKNPDFTLTDVEITECWGPWEQDYQGNKGGMMLSWATVSAGFGTLTLILSNEGKLVADTEGMSKQFCKAVLSKLIDSLADDQE